MREKSSNTVQYKIILTVICIGLIFFFCMGVLLDTLLDRFFREVYFFYEPLSNIELREGETVTLTYELSVNKYPVSFLKDNQFIAETTHIKKRVAGRTKELEFRNVAPCDAGQYCLKVEGNTSVNSHLTELLIHPMFTSKIEPQLCIEGNKLHLACAVYTDNIEVKWYKENEQLHECENILIHIEKYQRMLTIEKTTVADSGNYYVKAGKVEMRIPVTVKDMFRRPLVDETIMEGLDTKFEFETEEENVPVQWFYNRKEIIESTERRQISRLQGRVHTLTILQTRLEDSGKYSIRIKAYDKTVGLHVKEMPQTIKNMSVSDRKAFLKAANTGTTKRYNIRVMISGKQSAGKTCLLRRLMNEDIDGVISTDGINIERRKCQIDIKTGLWHFCKYISEDFKSKTYENMIEKEFDSIGEYIDFWLDNIHCYCTDDKNTSMECHEDGTLNPPVIIIGTGIDKIPLVCLRYYYRAKACIKEHTIYSFNLLGVTSLLSFNERK
ncbi:TTN [Mytilus edulis]|uniref:TTN n=1 Tax=Mytilus edulis TaxID=6550 RepID=A0A8S3Q6R5_MYTED|nr:TTN [Mytilus edulis]